MAPKYMAALEDKNQIASQEIFERMSPIDHVFAVLKMIDEGADDTDEKKDALAKEMFDQGQLLGENELLLLSRWENETMKEIFLRVLQINLNDKNYRERFRVFKVAFRLGQFEAIGEHLEAIGV